MNNTIKTIIVGMYRTNCYLVINEDTKECVVIDPGDEAHVIKQAIKTCGAEPKAVLLTHGHTDHIDALVDIKQEYGIECYAGEKETFYLKGFLVEHRVRDNDVIEAAGIKLKVLETPGHSEGSICFYWEEKNILFSGDTMFYSTYGRTDFETGSFEDMRVSMARLLRLPAETKVFPGHGFSTTIAFESARNEILRDL